MTGFNEAEIGRAIMADMIKGFGPGFPPLEELFAIELTTEDIQRLESPTPYLGRYYKSNAFLKDVTSAASIGLKRFNVIVEYFIALSELMETYKGSRPKIIRQLTPEEKAWLRRLGTTYKEIKIAEAIEKFSEHDTAAAGDSCKLRTGYYQPSLAAYIEGIQFMETSEDTMSIVFGLIGNQLVYHHFMVKLIDFCLSRIEFARKFDLIIPALTHEQAAEPTTIAKKFANRLNAINNLINELVGNNGEFKPFSGKLNGAVGNFTSFYAAYPDIDWPNFARKFVEEKFGLFYEDMTDQCASFTREAFIFSVIGNILTQVIKLTDDFIKSARCPAQFFVKAKKAGTKGSTIMPTKSNAWGQEGGKIALKKSRHMLTFLSENLPDYPDEGNMARSILFRDIGSDFMPAFTGLDRIGEEMGKYIPNQDNIREFFDRYPGMSGSSIQIALKAHRILGDAYRVIQEIAINPDGSYAKSEQFKDGFEKKMEQLGLSEEVRVELRSLLAPENLIKKAREMAFSSLAKLETAFKEHRERALKIKTI